MIKKALFLIILFLVIASVSLVWHMPASWAIKQVHLPRELKLKQVQGKIWQGSVAQLQWQQWLVQPLSWQVSVLPLLQQQLQLQLNGYFYNSPFNAKVSAQQNQLDLLKGHYRNNINNLAEVFAKGMINLGGKVTIEVKTLQIKDQKATRLQIKSQWTQASIEAPFQLKLGKISIHSKLVDNKIVNEIQGLAGDLDINGTIIITQNQDFSARLKLHPNKKLPQEVSLSLKMFAQTLPNGDMLINRKGNLRYLRLM